LDSGSKWIARLYKHHCQQNVDQRSLKASWLGCGVVEQAGKKRDRQDGPPRLHPAPLRMERTAYGVSKSRKRRDDTDPSTSAYLPLEGLTLL
jgi:hypothetical protein